MSIDENALKTGESRPSYVEFEERAATIYLDLARRFRDNTELSWFWLGMSMAEKQHAVVLAFCECQQLLCERPPADSPDTRGLSDLLRKLESRAAQRDLSVDDAFVIASELEASEINAIYERLVRPAQGTSYFERKKVETLGVNHPHILLKAAEKFGVSAPVLQKLTQFEQEGPRV
jgi:hypothetical protein